ncbi:MAG: ATP-binding protein [Bacillota bacterium]
MGRSLIEGKREKELILENLSEQVSYLDSNMRLVWANRHVCERHGLYQKNYLGRKCYELFHDFNEPCPGCPVPEAVETGRVTTGEVVSPDGHFWELTSTPVFLENEGLVGVLHFAYDVTDLKATEAELKELSLELEKRVEERTAELKSVIKELDAFTYSVSHDLRAPVRSIEGFSRVILEDHIESLDSEGKRYFKRILAATGRTRSLIDDLMKLSHVTRHEIKHGKVNISRLAEMHIKELQEKEPDRDIQVVIEPDIYVYGDQALLEIALANLLDNAWKFTAGVDGASIKFGSQINTEGIICYVQDQGVGFDQNYADKLFSPFQRLHSQEDYPGTGIGLSIVSRIIHRHGGEVWAEGEPGQGATFYFKLPLNEDRA